MASPKKASPPRRPAVAGKVGVPDAPGGSSAANWQVNSYIDSA